VFTSQPFTPYWITSFQDWQISSAELNVEVNGEQLLQRRDRDGSASLTSEREM